MNLLKKQSAGFYTSLVTALLGILSLIFICVVASDGEGMAVSVYPMVVIGTLLVILNMVLANFEKTRKYTNFGNGLVPLFYAIMVVMFFIGRMTWFMNLASKNNVTSMYPFFIFTAVFLIITFIMSIVNAFFTIRKEDDKRVEENTAEAA